MATPGHTLGGVTLLVGDAMFSGDTLFAGSMGRTDLPGGNGEQMVGSLRRLGQIKGEYTVYPGHMRAHPLARAGIQPLYPPGTAVIKDSSHESTAHWA